MNLRILSSTDVVKALPMAEAIAAMKDAFAQLSAGEATVPLRPKIEVAAHAGVSLFMPAYLAGKGDLAIKVVSVFSNNPKRNLPLIHAVVLVLESDTGRPLALLEGGAVTAIRTGAGAGAATDLLARPESSITAIFGAGVQARTQLEAVCTVRKIKRVLIYDKSTDRAQRMAEEMAGKGPIPSDIRVAQSPPEAIAEADIVSTATTSTTPVFDGHDLRPGTHVNAIGAYLPEMQEIDVETIRRALVVVDSRESALNEPGDIIIPLKSGAISESHIHAELGEIVAGKRPGRANPDQITFFKSCGTAVQDAAAARVALQNAERLNLGTTVAL
ncbi:MAG: ornithine cyclodeaminase family protein [Chloroflexi bacterium]|nr:ornithine cyclodeaminase family protein [Chloroflexota bacterium]